MQRLGIAAILGLIVALAGSAAGQDSDFDEVPDSSDNCPLGYNPPQADEDLDGVGDVCDCCPADFSASSGSDLDGDKVCETCGVEPDNCPAISNETQSDQDADGVGDACDICPRDPDAGQPDADGDAAGDSCDVAPGSADPPMPFFTRPAADTNFLGRPAGATAAGRYVQPRRVCDVDNEWFEFDCELPEGEADCLGAGGVCRDAVFISVDDISPAAPYVNRVDFFATGPDPNNDVSCGSYSFIGFDNDPSEQVLEVLDFFPGVSPEGSNPFAFRGWNGIFFPPADGLYCLRAEMQANTPAGPSQGVEEILVQVDSDPSVPRFLNTFHMQHVSGIFDLEMEAPDAQPVNYEVLLEKRGNKGQGFDQIGLGSERQSKVSRAGDSGANNNCAPTAAKNALHRLAAGDSRIFIDPNDPDRNIRMARRIGQLMRTNTGEGTAWQSMVDGIVSYLEERGIGCKNASGYTATHRKINHKRNMAKFRPEDPDGVTWRFYEREMRKGEAVVLSIHPWNPSSDGRYGTKDDLIGYGHTITGKGGEKDGFAAGAHKFRFVDPVTGGEVETVWQQRGGFPSVVYKDMVWIVYGIVSVSPKQTTPGQQGAGTGTFPNSAMNPNAGINHAIDTAAYDDGVYIVTVRTEDAAGNLAKNEVALVFDQSFTVPSLERWALALLLGLMLISALLFLRPKPAPRSR